MPDAGWYPDPGGQHRFRRWDGAAWTTEVSGGGLPAPPTLTGTVVEMSRFAVASFALAVLLIVLAYVPVVGGWPSKLSIYWLLLPSTWATAIALGFLALYRMRRPATAARGRRLAIAGIVIGSALLALWTFVVVFLLIFPK